MGYINNSTVGVIANDGAAGTGSLVASTLTATNGVTSYNDIVATNGVDAGVRIGTNGDVTASGDISTGSGTVYGKYLKTQTGYGVYGGATGNSLLQETYNGAYGLTFGASSSGITFHSFKTRNTNAFTIYDTNSQFAGPVVVNGSLAATNGGTFYNDVAVTNGVDSGVRIGTNGNVTASGTNYVTKLRVGGAAETADAVNVTGAVTSSDRFTAPNFYANSGGIQINTSGQALKWNTRANLSSDTTGLINVGSGNTGVGDGSLRLLNLAASGTGTFTNGVIHYQLAVIPTNSVPPGSATETNWWMGNISGIPTLVATNYVDGGWIEKALFP